MHRFRFNQVFPLAGMTPYIAISASDAAGEFTLADFMQLQIKCYSKLPNEAFSSAKCILLKQRSEYWLKVETSSCIHRSRSPFISENYTIYSRAMHTYWSESKFLEQFYTLTFCVIRVGRGAADKLFCLGRPTRTYFYNWRKLCPKVKLLIHVLLTWIYKYTQLTRLGTKACSITDTIFVVTKEDREYWMLMPLIIPIMIFNLLSFLWLTGSCSNWVTTV